MRCWLGGCVRGGDHWLAPQPEPVLGRDLARPLAWRTLAHRLRPRQSALAWLRAGAGLGLPDGPGLRCATQRAACPPLVVLLGGFAVPRQEAVPLAQAKNPHCLRRLSSDRLRRTTGRRVWWGRVAVAWRRLRFSARPENKKAVGYTRRLGGTVKAGEKRWADGLSGS